ncbi:MAG: radical SAM protein, partial [Chloroflexi bacterium]|nr:radical SAM protein [Chloroflexota bacterium]
TDPYQPIEGKYRLTRRCLEAFVDWRSPVSLVTKGTMAVRDADVMAELEQRAGCTVCFSVTTLDDELWRRLEPGTPPPKKRLAAMGRLVAAGVNAGVALAPVIPGLTDIADNMETVARAAADHGARFLWGSTLYLKPGTKEHFLEFLGREHPGLAASYGKLYPGAYASRLVQNGIQAHVGKLRAAYGLAERRSRRPDPQPRQLELALR